MAYGFQDIVLRVAPKRFESWEHFERHTPEYQLDSRLLTTYPGTADITSISTITPEWFAKRP